MRRKLKNAPPLEDYELNSHRRFDYVPRKLFDGELEHVQKHYEIIEYLGFVLKRHYQGADAIIRDPTFKYNPSGYYGAFFDKKG